MESLKNHDSIEQIAAILIHELKSPLALISANVDYLVLCDEDKKFFKNYSVVKSEIEKASRILNDFINVLNSSDENIKEGGICQIVSEIVESYISTYGKEIAFSFDYKADIAFLKSTADKMAYTIVFGNTIKNAVEAIKAAGRVDGKVSINSKKEGDNVVFEIEDNGIGLNKNVLDFLNRGECFTTKEHGSGVGISICKKIMGELGGSYSILGEYDAGCVARIKTPN